MRPLTEAELLNIWERGRTLGTVRRTLLLLAAACPEETTADLARLPPIRRRLLRSTWSVLSAVSLRALPGTLHSSFGRKCMLGHSGYYRRSIAWLAPTAGRKPSF